MEIRIKGLKKSYGTGELRQEVLKGIDCEIPSGAICAILGPSGSGKSTLLNILGGIEEFDEGEVHVGDYRLEALDARGLARYRRNELGFVFQSYNLVPNLTVRENIEVGAWLGKKPLDIDEVLEILDLTDHRGKVATQLSGGQQQRTAIGRAIVKNPSILLCDEPTGALDYETSLRVLGLIERIHERYGATILIVTHNEAISKMANLVLKLHDGRIHEAVRREKPLPAAEIAW